MKNRKNSHSKLALLTGLIFITLYSCERAFSEDVEFATFPKTGELFTDNFVGGLDYFPFGDSFAEAFSVDTDEAYLGSASMRFDIPQFGVGYGGATFPSTGPRDLSGFDALTFWAKASEGADINEIGFGINGDTNNKFQVTLQNLPLTTIWTKYVIAIPDASKLTQEKGMFWYAEGAESPEDDGGYTFWIDELKFEKLGTIAQPQPAILNGMDNTQISFNGTNITISGLTQTLNLASGVNQTVSAAPAYFTFASNNTDVAIVNELGVVSVIGSGTATITATLGNVLANGSLTINSLGNFEPAPVPTENANSVISVFSNAYTNVPVDFYTSNYLPFQTTTSGHFTTTNENGNADDILYYLNYNFVGIEFNQNVPTIDASSMNTMHLDIFIQEAFDPASTLKINLRDYGADGNFDGGDDTLTSILLSTTSTPALQTSSWISVDLDISGMANKNNLGQIVFDAEGNTTPRPSSFYVDNIYFY